VLAPKARGVSLPVVVVATAAYLLLVPAPELTRRLRRAQLLPVIGGMLLVDGIYLAWVSYATGGAQSPLRFLVFVHVVAVTLLASYRTGLKIAAWHSILLFVAFYAQSAGILRVRETLLSALPGRGDDFQLVSMLNIAALWGVALGTATFSALSERELRAQKIDLERMSGVVSEIDQRAAASEIPVTLLERLCEVFGFTRGVVLTSPPKEDELSLVASHGAGGPGPVPEGLDPVMERAWNSRKTQLVRGFDPAVDRRLDALIPGGRNLLIVPLFLEGSYRLGILVLEHPGKGDSIKRWVVALVEQCAAHASLALHNAWLLEEIQQQLEDIRALEMKLFAQNVELESQVEERTKELRQSLEDVRTMDGQRRRLLSRLVNAEEEERRRIAREVHDGPIQQMVAIGMQLEMLRRRLATLEPDVAAKTLEQAVGRVKGSVDVMRTLIFELRPSVLDEKGLASAIAEYGKELDSGMRVRVDSRLRREPSDETRLTLYRIAQEALVNVRKHAKAKSVEVFLEEREGGFLVQIQDDGVGFSPPDLLRSTDGHLGLTSMRERAEMAGGKCEIRSFARGGTMVEFWVPAGRPALRTA
jgi:signal transduction histidine kinase